MTNLMRAKLDLSIITVVTLAMLATGAGCGSDDEESDCGTIDNPRVLTVRDVEPAAGTTVVNEDIIHTYTVVNPPGVFGDTTSRTTSDHTAGAFDPPQSTVTSTREGADVRYEFSPLRWATAPAHVEFEIVEVFRDDSDCYYRLPTPLFSYEIVPPSFDGGSDAPFDDLGVDGGGGDGGTDGGGDGG